MKNSRTRKFATIALAAVVGVVLGMLTRASLGLGRSSTPEAGATQSAAHESEEDRTRSLTALDADTEGGMQQKREALELVPRSKRLLWFAARAEGADAEGLARLMRLSGRDMVVRRMLATRWAELDPQHMFDTLTVQWDATGRFGYRVMRTLTEAWAKSDPQGMIAALSDERAFRGIGSARTVAAKALMKSSPEDGLNVLELWKIRNYIPRMKGVLDWAKDDPRGAAEKVAAINGGRAGIEALAAVGQAWAGDDPKSALEYASELRGQRQREFAEKAMAVWAKDDLQGAIEFASAQDDIGFRGLIGSGLLAEWGKHDPAAALQWGQDNLQSQLRSAAIGELVNSLAKKDPRAAAELVGAMPVSGAQFTAVERLLSTWVRESDGRSAGEAIEWLATLPDHDLAQRALGGASWYFTMEDPDALISLVEGEHPHLLGGRVLSEAVSAQVRRSPLAAIEWAQGLPEDRSADIERSVVENWTRMQPGTASDWSVTLPAGDQRDFAVDTIARSFSHRPPEQLGLWYQQLNTVERARVREIVNGFTATDERRAEMSEALAD